MDKEKDVQTEAKGVNLANNKEEPLVRSFDSKNKSFMSRKSLIIFAVVILLGVASGYALSRVGPGVKGPGGSTSSGAGSYRKGDVIGSSDLKSFKDTAEGKLQKGGIEGEGAYHLVRPGGDSQNVYLTSSSVDLGPLVGRKIKVWGETNTAQTAGWLMDVGRVQVVN